MVSYMKMVYVQTCRTNAPQSLSLFCLPTFCNIKKEALLTVIETFEQH